MFRGTATCTPRMELMTMDSGDPECQMPSNRWPRVLTINGAFCVPLLR